MNRIAHSLSDIIMGAFAIIILEQMKVSIGESLQHVFQGWALVFIVAGFIGLFLVRTMRKVEMNIDAAPVDDRSDPRNRPVRGLVVFLSLYRRLGKTQQSTPEADLQAAADLNYDVLNLSDTSATTFGHQIEAIKSHKHSLKHCWVVCTRTHIPHRPQSIEFARVFKRYLEDCVLAKDATVHIGDEFALYTDDEVDVCKKTNTLLKKIYAQAKKLNIPHKDMLTDVTGGKLSMSTGALFACINDEDDIQMVCSNYDKEGNPIKPFPVRFSYSPKKIEE